MKRRKKLERAIVLGLLLSTSVYGNAWAEEHEGPITGSISEAGNIIITNDDPNKSAIIIDGSTDVVIKAQPVEEEYVEQIKVTSDGTGLHINKDKTGSITLNANDNIIEFGSSDSEGHGISVEGTGWVKLAADDGCNIIISQTGSDGDGINLGKYSDNHSVTLTAGISNIIIVNAENAQKDSDGIYTSEGSNKNITLAAGYTREENLNSGNIIVANNNGIDHRGEANIDLRVEEYVKDEDGNIIAVNYLGVNKITAGRGDGIRTQAGEGNITLNAARNEITSNEDNGIQSDGKGTIAVTAHSGNNEITGYNNGVYATNGAVDISAKQGSNIIYAREESIYDDGIDFGVFGTQKAVSAYKGTTVDLTAANANILYGAVYATNDLDQVYNEDDQKYEDKPAYGSGNTDITIGGVDNSGTPISNAIYSAAVIDGAGDINTSDEFIDEANQQKNKFWGKQFVSALYAEEGAHVVLTGENFVGTWADNDDDDYLERTVWAYNEGVIDVTGAAQIGTDRYSTSPNSADVAVAAGTATGLDEDKVNDFDDLTDKRAVVNINYNDFASGERSIIKGDVLAAYAGEVNINPLAENGRMANDLSIEIEGNLLAGNNGVLNVDLGQGGLLTGRADDYGDAGYVTDGREGVDSNGEEKTFYDPAFSSEIYKGGSINLTMGGGSRWNVTGQSWITSIDTTEAKGELKSERATIDLVNFYKHDEDDNTSAHALTVYNFNGDADFIMNLDGDRTNSDMLYMKQANGTYRIMLTDVITSDEINSDGNTAFNGLRFATVGNKNSDVEFLVGSYDNGGAFNVEYKVGTDEYGGAETAHENDVYNGASINSGKPGSDMVNNFFGYKEPLESETKDANDVTAKAANNIMLLSDEVEALADEEQNNNSAQYNATNYKIIVDDAKRTLNGTGETILNMSRANYSNAIYMDRLNKRLGEARYINGEEEDGMWVRIRHDRIGKTDAYRNQNTMYELGYDKKQDCDNGERRVGFAVDYMHGDTGYSDIAGKGEIDRYGLWLYDTWMGDKGHYVDYVAKWGHLSNDFEVYTMRNGDKVTGDYSNNVFSVSAEYGRKKDIGNDWYFEPQAQVQLARVTGADYVTSQDTKVSVDGINSLIGRAGFRLGKDFGEEKQSTVYIKADVLHEFLGDQDVYVYDKSSDNKWAGISYENEGTWYDVGFGFATMMSKNSYAFLDLEKSFGHDNDETYQINAGVQWTF